MGVKAKKEVKEMWEIAPKCDPKGLRDNYVSSHGAVSLSTLGMSSLAPVVVVSRELSHSFTLPFRSYKVIWTEQLQIRQSLDHAWLQNLDKILLRCVLRNNGKESVKCS